MSYLMSCRRLLINNGVSVRAALLNYQAPLEPLHLSAFSLAGISAL